MSRWLIVMALVAVWVLALGLTAAGFGFVTIETMGRLVMWPLVGLGFVGLVLWTIEGIRLFRDSDPSC